MKITDLSVTLFAWEGIPGTRYAAHTGRFGGTSQLGLLTLRTDDGIEGHAFLGSAYNPAQLDAPMLIHVLKPIVVGQDPLQRERLYQAMWQRARAVTVRAIGAVDIALWDIAGKAANLPLHRLLGGSGQSALPAYASLLKYKDPDCVAARTKLAIQQGYRHIKLHETGEAEVRAARDAAGSDIKLMVDTNCPWTPEEAGHMALKLRPYDLHWLEEPIFPPEDFAAIARLRAATGIAMAAGENNCTSFQFRDMFAAGAVDYAQPSVTKVGGVSEFIKVAALADAAGVTLMPHSPYFGPGFLATLQLAAARGQPGAMIERYHMDLEASLYGSAIDPVNGAFAVPQGPGLGCEPDPDVIKTYAA